MFRLAAVLSLCGDISLSVWTDKLLMTRVGGLCRVQIFSMVTFLGQLLPLL